MNISLFTRLGGLLLLAGFFYSCTASKANINELIGNKEYSRALNELDTRILQNPENADLYLQRANVSVALAQQEEPEDRLDYYIQTDDDLKSAQQLTTNNQNKFTIDSLRQQYWKEEHNAGLRLSENEEDSHHTKAVAHFTNAIQLNSGAITTYQNLSYLQFNDGNVDAAIETLLDALNNLDNPPVTLYENLGYLYLEKGNTSQAIHYYELANENVEGNLNLTFGLINAYIAEGQTGNALNLLEPLVAEQPHNAKLLNVYGTQLYEATVDILADLQSTYQAGDTVLVEQLLLEAEAMGEEAEKHLQEAFKRDTLNTEYIESLAVFYNNMAGQYFNMNEAAFENHSNELTNKALTLIDFAIDYYERLEAIEPSNDEYKNKLVSLRRLKQNRSADISE